MLFIINPTAARGRAPRDWFEARRELLSQNLNIREIFTSRSGDATAITRREIQSGELYVIAVGGDGTLNEVVNGYFDEDGRVINSDAAIGLLPNGTGSDFRRSLGLMTRDAALESLLAGRTQQIDAIHVQLIDREERQISRIAINLVSLGFSGEAIKLIDRWRRTWPKWVGGQIRFKAAAVAALNQYHLRTVKLCFDGSDELSIESDFLVVANGRFAGSGMMLAPNADLTDGLLDIILTIGATRWDVIKELPAIQRGAHLDNPKVRERRARCVKIDAAEPLAIDIDGEPAGMTPATLTILPSAIRFIVKTDRRIDRINKIQDKIHKIDEKSCESCPESC